MQNKEKVRITYVHKLEMVKAISKSIIERHMMELHPNGIYELNPDKSVRTDINGERILTDAAVSQMAHHFFYYLDIVNRYIEVETKVCTDILTVPETEENPKEKEMISIFKKLKSFFNLF